MMTSVCIRALKDQLTVIRCLLASYPDETGMRLVS